MVDVSLFSGDGSIEKVSCVELHRGLRREDLQHAAAAGFADASSELEAAAVSLDDEVLVVTAGQHKLLIRIADARANRRGPGKIERRAGDSTDLARGNQFAI